MRFDGLMLDELERPATRRGRIAVRWIAAAVAFVVAVALAGLPVYVFPRTDKPVKSDAIVVLGPSTDQRVALGTRLLDEGYAPHLYLSMPADRLNTAVCRQRNTSCFMPAPFTTRGEARFTQQEARANGWSSVIVITTVFHISRARFIFDRCSGVDDVRMVRVHEPADAIDWTYEYVYQTAGFVKAAIVGCADE